jgi:type IV pilus assembly protein PilA
MGATSLRGERGFTLIEMLVVVLIVATLAVIAMASFLNQRSKAQDAQAKTAATNVALAMFEYGQDHETFAGADPAELIRLEPSIAEARGLVVDGDVNSFEISVTSASAQAGGGPFVIEHSSGSTVRRCDEPGRGGCPDTGFW